MAYFDLWKLEQLEAELREIVETELTISGCTNKVKDNFVDRIIANFQRSWYHVHRPSDVELELKFEQHCRQHPAAAAGLDPYYHGR